MAGAALDESGLGVIALDGAEVEDAAGEEQSGSLLDELDGIFAGEVGQAEAADNSVEGAGEGMDIPGVHDFKAGAGAVLGGQFDHSRGEIDGFDLKIRSLAKEVARDIAGAAADFKNSGAGLGNQLTEAVVGIVVKVEVHEFFLVSGGQLVPGLVGKGVGVHFILRGRR